MHSYVGFRTIEKRGRELFLNGEQLRIAGVLDQGFWPDTVYAATDAQLRADVEAAKAAGFNLARKHVKVEDPRWYACCDRLGLLVAQDMPSEPLSRRPSRRASASWREWLEIVGQLRGHPSVAMWIPINEDWGEPPPDFQRELVRATRDGRPVAARDRRLRLEAARGHRPRRRARLRRELTQHVGKRRDDIPLWIGELGGLSLGSGDFVYRHVDDLAEAIAA